MKPYETVSIRGIPVNNVKSVRVFGTGEELGYKKRISVIDILTQNPTPNGELIISVPDHAVDPYATVIAIDFAQMA